MVQWLQTGDVIDLAQTGYDLNVHGVTSDGPVKSVWWNVNTQSYGIDSSAPFTLSQDGVVEAFRQPGLYGILALPFSESNGQGSVGRATVVVIEVVDSTGLEDSNMTAALEDGDSE